MRAVIILATLSLAACNTPAVDKPCGVISDSLVDVRGATPADDQRISRHHARGVGARCWPAAAGAAIGGARP